MMSMKRLHTVHSGVVRLDVNRLDFAVLNDQSVTLATIVAEDRSAIEGEVEALGELTRGIAQKADLCLWVNFDRLMVLSEEGKVGWL